MFWWVSLERFHREGGLDFGLEESLPSEGWVRAFEAAVQQERRSGRCVPCLRQGGCRGAGEVERHGGALMPGPTGLGLDCALQGAIEDFSSKKMTLFPNTTCSLLLKSPQIIIYLSRSWKVKGKLFVFLSFSSSVVI